MELRLSSCHVPVDHARITALCPSSARGIRVRNPVVVVRRRAHASSCSTRSTVDTNARTSMKHVRATRCRALGTVLRVTGVRGPRAPCHVTRAISAGSDSSLRSRVTVAKLVLIPRRLVPATRMRARRTAKLVFGVPGRPAQPRAEVASKSEPARAQTRCMVVSLARTPKRRVFAMPTLAQSTASWTAGAAGQRVLTRAGRVSRRELVASSDTKQPVVRHASSSALCGVATIIAALWTAKSKLGAHGALARRRACR